QALAINGAQVAVGLFQPVGAALIWVASVGRLLHAGLLALAARGSTKPAAGEEGGGEASLAEVARRYRDFPLFRAPQVLVNAASQSLPVVLLAAFFGPATAGFYTLCRTVLGVPSQLIGSSVGDVFYPRIAEAAARG